MLSYRHAFHAGNHADVLKHVVLAELLRYLGSKEKPYWYIDTHAGAGDYRLAGEQDGRRAEYRDGIARLWDLHAAPAALARYLALVRAHNPDGRLARYPGSPLIAGQLLRADDRAWLAELHPADFDELQRATAGRRVRAERRDGFDWLNALLPPAPRRALVMIDPSYEVKNDYRRVERALAAALERFATGSYATWYPLLGRRDAAALPAALQRIAGPSWLQVELDVDAARADGGGLRGSGLFVVNPPYTLPQALAECLPVLVERLGQGRGAAQRLDYRIP